MSEQSKRTDTGNDSSDAPLTKASERPKYGPGAGPRHPGAAMAAEKSPYMLKRPSR